MPTRRVDYTIVITLYRRIERGADEVLTLHGSTVDIDGAGPQVIAANVLAQQSKECAESADARARGFELESMNAVVAAPKLAGTYDV